MRRARKKASVPQRAANQKDLNIVRQTLTHTVRESMKTYAAETNLERAIPDFRDGFKPVGRRLLFAASTIAKETKTKSARIIGEVIGKYHPHGDMSVGGALATLVNNGTNEFTGIGNWGTPTDPPAAPRYTEVHLSKYGRSFFARYYIDKQVTPFVPTYDRALVEPLVLPALLPNVFFNGGQGIGVGLRSSLPSFTPPSVLTLMCRLLRGEQLEPSDYAKTLKFFEPWGAQPSRDKKNRKAILEFMKSSNGSVQFESDIEVLRDNKIIRIRAVAPGINEDKLVAKLRAMPEVSQCYSNEGLVIEAKRNINYVEFDALVGKLEKMTVASQHYQILVTERMAVKGSEIGEYRVRFHELSIPELMVLWLKWRVKLEHRSLAHQIKLQQAIIARTELLIFACDKLAVIFKALRSPDPEAYLMKHLKLSKEDANTILELKVRQLSKLDQDALRNLLKEQKAHLKNLQIRVKNPAKQVHDFLETCIDQFHLVDSPMGQKQWLLR